MDAVYATHNHGLLLPMMEQSEEITGAKAAVTLADSGYFAGSDLEECIQRGQHRVWMESGEGREMHKRRQRLAGPVFGIIKKQLETRRFLLRGLAKVSAEWTALANAVNLRTLWKGWSSRPGSLLNYSTGCSLAPFSDLNRDRGNSSSRQIPWPPSTQARIR